MGNFNIHRKILFISVFAVVIGIIIYICIYFFNDTQFVLACQLHFLDDGEIQLTDGIRKSFLRSDYFANIIDIDKMPEKTEKITLEYIKDYTNLMNKLFTALRYDNKLTLLKEPLEVNGFQYDYKIKSSELINILREVYDINEVIKEDFSTSEKYVNSLYYNESDDICYISSIQTNMEDSCNFIGVEKLSKLDDIYTMELYYFNDNVVDTTLLPSLIESKNNDNNIITGNFDEVDKSGEGRSCKKKKITFKINSLFGKNKFKILSVENINN